MRLLIATTVLVLGYASTLYATQWQEEPDYMGFWGLYFGTSELDDSQAVYGVVYDDWRAHNSSFSSLGFGCEEKRPYVAYYFAREGEHVGNNMISINFRLDKNSPKSAEWIPLADGTGALIEYADAEAFMLEASQADELYIRSFSHNFGERDARYLLLGIREVVYQIFRACKIDG